MIDKTWKCPYAIADKRFRFLMCKKHYDKFAVNGKISETDAPCAICAEQKFCLCVRAPINIEGAKKCYENQLRKEKIIEEKRQDKKNEPKPRTKTARKTKQEN